MSEPLFWTRCPEADSSVLCKQRWCECHGDGYVGWPQPCPDCDGWGTEVTQSEVDGPYHQPSVPPCPAGCDGGRVWPQGWEAGSRYIDKHHEWGGKTLFVPLEEP